MPKAARFPFLALCGLAFALGLAFFPPAPEANAASHGMGDNSMLNRGVFSKSADYTVKREESEAVFVADAADLTFTLPKADHGLIYTFEVGALSSTTGLSISPASTDRIEGLSSDGVGVDNKDAINPVGRGIVGDYLVLVSNGVDGWNIAASGGHWEEEDDADATQLVITGANLTLTSKDCGKTFYATAADLVFTLPSTSAGCAFTVVTGALSSGTGTSLSPAAADKFVGLGFASTDNKDAINSGATDALGDFLTVIGDETGLGWYITTSKGTWAEEA